MNYTAKTADKFILYQEAVQAPEAEVAFIDRVYKKLYGRPATLFREDFCGTQLISCAWARLRAANHAWGVDLDGPTLAWGLEHNIAPLEGGVADRVHQLQQNVFHVIRPRVEIVGAFNFSYFIFKERRALTAYFRAVKKSLVSEGLFVLDCYGGWDSQKVQKERTRYKGFVYIWDQAKYDPVTDHTLCHIHFAFPDGSVMRKAFTYDWRLWTIGGIRDCLYDAGFSHTEVYWEGTTRSGKGNGVYRPAKEAENDPAWVAYITATP